MVNMLFQTLAVLALSASVIAHPRSSRHRHPFTPSGSGKVVAPTGGTYGMGNSTSAYRPTATGFVTGMSVVVPTKIASESPVDTAISPESDGSACIAGSTTTIYSTDLVTLTVTAEDTITMKSPSASASHVGSTYPLSNATVTSAKGTGSPSGAASSPMTSQSPANVTATGVVETGTPLAPASSGTAASSEPSADITSPTATETSSLASVEPSATPSEVTSATSAAPAATSESPVESPETSYPSSTMNAPAGFYQVSSAAASSSAAPVSPSAPSTGSYGTGKRGLAYNSAALTNVFAGKSMAWAYNWAANPSGTLASGIEYVPMLWGQTAFSGWDAAAKAAIAAGAKHLLSFNEPDLAAQANMDSATAAAAHIKYMNPYAGQAKIGSPAVTNGGPSGGSDGMGLGWMQNFFDKCAGNCKVDFLTFHWYDSAENAAYFKNYVQDVIAMAKKNGVNKVWLTEFAASGSDEQAAKFLAEVLPWMDGNDAVERYAYFMCGDGELLSGTSMSAVGKAYAA